MKSFILAAAVLAATAGAAFAGGYGEKPTDIEANMGSDGLPVWLHPKLSTASIHVKPFRNYGSQHEAATPRADRLHNFR